MLVRHDTTGARRLLLVVADGVRPDVLAEEMDAGRAPALAALRQHGSAHTITTSFPSVTGPAYVPFLMGTHPARVGMPGLRWFDRSRSLRWASGQSRSYAGIDIWHIDGDLATDVPTLLEYAQPSLVALSMIGRGATHGRIGRGVGWMFRAAPAHFRGDLLGWRRVEQYAHKVFFERFARIRPRMSVLGILSGDKFAHKYGPRSDAVRTAVADVDTAVATAQRIAERDGWRESLHIWLTGDHGHDDITQHEDLHGWLEGQGLRVRAHPRLSVRNPDVVLMVGGNAMAHLYFTPNERARRWWSTHAPAWDRLLDRLVERPAIDLLAVNVSADVVQIRHHGRGTAEVRHSTRGADARWSYVCTNGDPLELGGSLHDLDAGTAWEVTAGGRYPDALVQLSLLGAGARSGDVLVSAAEGWDLRARFEPVPHVSTHGALLRDQMLVPLIVDVPVTRMPQRTADIVPSALDLLAIPAAATFDGRSFLR